MALTSEDLMALGNMRGMSPYESFMVSEKTGRRASGTSIAAITIASAGALAAYSALWVELLLSMLNHLYNKLWQRLKNKRKISR